MTDETPKMQVVIDDSNEQPGHIVSALARMLLSINDDNAGVDNRNGRRSDKTKPPESSGSSGF